MSCIYLGMSILFGASLITMTNDFVVARPLGSRSLMFVCCRSGADDQRRGSGAVCQGGSDIHHGAHPAGVDPHRGQQAPHATGNVTWVCRSSTRPGNFKSRPRLTFLRYNFASRAVTRSSKTGREEARRRRRWRAPCFRRESGTHLDAARAEPPSRT